MFRYALISLPLSIAIFFWLKDGARLSFWATSEEIHQEVPIVEGMPELGSQTQVIWKDRFMCGIETPILGLALSSLLTLGSLYQKRSLKKSPH
jgi:hypothetical protein